MQVRTDIRAGEGVELEDFDFEDEGELEPGELSFLGQGEDFFGNNPILV